MTKVCVVGSDGRADVLRDVLGRTAEVVVSPGRPGVPNSVETKPEELDDYDLYVISPEQPLVEGLADRLRAQGKAVFGPGDDGAQLEGSKRFMKEVVDAAGVPTAVWVAGTIADLPKLEAFVRKHNGLVAVKTDGLAAGKGVLVCNSVKQALADIHAKLSGKSFGDAGRTVVVEALLPGTELSVFVAVDGHGGMAIFDAAQDFKRLRDRDAGPNTGGMGSFSPVPGVSREFLEEVAKSHIQPVVDELQKRGIEYRGFLYCGLMLTPDGPKVLEFNVRFGDPEAQSVLPRVSSDLTQLLLECANGELKSQLSFSDEAAVAVVLAAKGYAEWDKPKAGDVITGLEAARKMEGVSVYCAGTGQNDDGELVTAGGRIMAVVGRGKDLGRARSRAYSGLHKIHWAGQQYRIDIGPKAA